MIREVVPCRADDQKVTLHLVLCADVEASKERACLHAAVALDAPLGINDSLYVTATSTLVCDAELVDLYVAPTVTYLVARTLEPLTQEALASMQEAGWDLGGVATNSRGHMIGVVLPPPAHVIVPSQGWPERQQHVGQWLRENGVMAPAPHAVPLFASSEDAAEVTDILQWRTNRRKPVKQ